MGAKGWSPFWFSMKTLKGSPKKRTHPGVGVSRNGNHSPFWMTRSRNQSQPSTRPQNLTPLSRKVVFQVPFCRCDGERQWGDASSKCVLFPRNLDSAVNKQTPFRQNFERKPKRLQPKVSPTTQVLERGSPQRSHGFPVGNPWVLEKRTTPCRGRGVRRKCLGYRHFLRPPLVDAWTPGSNNHLVMSYKSWSHLASGWT